MRKYGVDKDGFIKTEVGLNKIKPPFTKIFTHCKAEIVNKLGDKIHSLYVYGSVTTGKAYAKKSDLDLLLVLKNKPTSKIKEQVDLLQRSLSDKHKHLVREVGISLTFINEVRKDNFGWGYFIKHLSVCVYGEDISRGLPKFKPSKEVAKAFNGDIAKHIDNILKKFKSPTKESEILLTCSQTMKKIIRTGFCLVMDEEKSWTTDLEKSCQIFSKYYPKQAPLMMKALNLAKKPVADKKMLGKFLENFGSWL